MKLQVLRRALSLAAISCAVLWTALAAQTTVRKPAADRRTPPTAQVPQAPPTVPYTTGSWDSDKLGNHRVVLEVSTPADAVRVRVPWRRRDTDPEKKGLILIDGMSGSRIANVVRVSITREAGDIVFQPLSGRARYFLYYLPNVGSGRSNYPTVTYLEAEADETAQAEWLAKHGLSGQEDLAGRARDLPAARVVEFQSIDEFNSFYPMEVIATADEVLTLLGRNPEADYLAFPEDRRFPVRMTDDLPLRWIEAGASASFRGNADRGEFYAFQVGVLAARRTLDAIDVAFSDFRTTGGAAIPATAARCFNTGGRDWMGRSFKKTVTVPLGKVQALWMGLQVPESAAPGEYNGEVTIAPAGLAATRIPVTITVSNRTITASGDNEPARHSRLRWLDSTLAVDDEVVAPYTPVQLRDNTVAVLGRTVVVGRHGFPERIRSWFAQEMTATGDKPRDILAGPVRLVAEGADTRLPDWTTSGVRFVKRGGGAVSWESGATAGPLTLRTRAQMEFDGNIEFEVEVRATQPASLKDIRLEIPLTRDVARYMMGLGVKGGLRPAAFDWTWDQQKNQDSAWLGDVNAGLQFTLKDDKYSRPLNTNFYLSKPLVMPASWSNGGRGGCRMRERAESVVVECYSGARTMKQDEVQRYDLRLLVTPFHTLDTRAQFTTRYFHAYKPVAEAAATGANTLNIHHANAINPYINYPFLRPAEMTAYIDEAHARGLRVKIYYTVRELSNRAPELFALRSLGDEILSKGPGGGFSWLQEHLGGDYIAAWFVPELKDAAVINTGVSRWHNYYVEGLNWLAKNVGIDGLYIDDVAFDRTTMKRVRKVLDRNRAGALIDLHSANQFNDRDGFANSANLYLEHFPFLNRLWFGEYFDYDSAPDFWLVEVSGLPFGLMGEMLQDNGNPWRGMVFGMTGRLPWAGDPRPLWKAWDTFGIADSRMVGFWVDARPVKADHADVLVTSYVREGRTMVALASWSKETVDVKLAIDWAGLGLDPAKAVITAPAIDGFQPARTLAAGESLPVEPGKGWLLVIQQ